MRRNPSANYSHRLRMLHCIDGPGDELSWTVKCHSTRRPFDTILNVQLLNRNWRTNVNRTSRLGMDAKELLGLKDRSYDLINVISCPDGIVRFKANHVNWCGSQIATSHCDTATFMNICRIAVARSGFEVPAHYSCTTVSRDRRSFRNSSIVCASSTALVP